MTVKAWMWIGFGVLVILGALANRANRANEGNSKAPSAESAPAAEALEELQAADIFSLYEENEIRGDRILKGKRFLVLGTVKSIGKDITGAPYLALEAGSPIFGVQAMFGRGDAMKLAGFSPGDQARAACTGGGKLGNVILRDCELR